MTPSKYSISVLDEMRSLAKHSPRITLLGKEFLIYQDVFHPSLSIALMEFMTTQALKVVVEEMMKKSEEASFHFLEVGCGAGYTAIHTTLASQKCKVWAADINDTAVKNTTENAKLHGVDDRLTAVTADVFDHEEFAGKEFDVIYWDFPWCGLPLEPGTKQGVLMCSLVDPEFQALRRYLSQATNFLKKTGRIFVAFSFNLDSKELFEAVLNETGWSCKISSAHTFLLEVGGDQGKVEVSFVELVKQGCGTVN